MKNIIYTFTVILLLCYTYLFIQNQHLESEIYNHQKINSQIKHEIYNLRLHKMNRSYEILLNGKEINKNDIVIDKDGNTILLRNIIKSNKLILRYSELNCNTCIDEQINNLNKFASDVGVENIILLTTYQNYVDMQKFRKVNKIKYEIYNMAQTLNEEIKDIGAPYYFILNEKNFRINNMYIAMEEIPLLTTTYFDNIKKNYFEIKVKNQEQ